VERGKSTSHGLWPKNLMLYFSGGKGGRGKRDLIEGPIISQGTRQGNNLGRTSYSKGKTARGSSKGDVKWPPHK